MAYTGYGSERHKEIVGILYIVSAEAHLILLDETIFFLQTVIDHLHRRRLKLEGCHHVSATERGFAGHCPRALTRDLLIGAARTLLGKHNFFHHLPHDAIGKNDGGSAVFKCQIKSEEYKIGHLLH